MFVKGVSNLYNVGRTHFISTCQIFPIRVHHNYISTCLLVNKNYFWQVSRATATTMASQGPLRFDGRVAIVTGAGGGLGKEYALLLGERGASVVVNDLGGSSSGEGKSQSLADIVVKEITDKGGKAVANYDSVEDGNKIVKTAIDKFGRIDIVINNAGILRDKTFINIEEKDWDLINAVHLRGAFQVTRAAWPYLRDQKYGRVIVTSSTSGLHGNFGQANYSAAKLGLVGLSNTLALEGAKYNIHCNAIVPLASSRLTEDLMPPDALELLQPHYIAPIVTYLCHESCKENGAIIAAAGGHASKYRWQRSSGAIINVPGERVKLEEVRDNWNKVIDMDSPTYPASNQEFAFNMLETLRKAKDQQANRAKAGTGSLTDAIGHQFNPTVFKYDEKDTILYALGIGISTKEDGHLKYLFEGTEHFATFPSFGVIIAGDALSKSGLISGEMPGPQLDLTKLLHGEQYLKILKPLDVRGNIRCQASVADVVDKGSGALILLNVDGFSGEELVLQAQYGLFFVGSGGFNGKRNSDVAVPLADAPKRQPDHVVKFVTSVDQAALYRLSGDRNPLHIDPDFAALAGFSKPILHGLCTYGITLRQVLKHFANDDVTKFKAIKARFVKPVYPGETLQVEMWQEKSRILVQTKVVESGAVVLSGAYVDLAEVVEKKNDLIKILGGGPSPAPTSNKLESDAVFEELIKRLKAAPEMPSKVDALFLYVITKNGKPAAHWTLDLRKSSKGGEIYRGEPRDSKAQCTFTLDDADMISLSTGQLNPQKAFMSGKLKLAGNIMLSQKLQALMKSEQSKL